MKKAFDVNLGNPKVFSLIITKPAIRGIDIKKSINALDLQIKDIEKLSNKRDVEVICKSIVEFYQRKIAEAPPLGAKPVILFQASDDCPRARYDGLPCQYNINLTCLHPYTSPSQTIYQFAHELGHFYQYPSDFRRISLWLPLGLSDLLAPWNNWFVESCCCALSYLCLDEVSKILRLSRRHQHLKNWVKPINEYRLDRINEALKEQNISSTDKVAEWIQSGAGLVLILGPELSDRDVSILLDEPVLLEQQ
ncbi:MAG: hypothetical protein NTV15_00410, partial [Candidatus Bathyarchaeota archaeon]|nr:hypothetical protein [Candidatus Bathyarchaeota archaeon]